MLKFIGLSARVSEIILLLEEFSNQLGKPHTKNIDNNLFEIRIKSKKHMIDEFKSEF
ncbi:type II toxin-antitoxin system RelE/ParE family toxin [Campylobacter iguaniorum]|uniref:type II toxin-antitoxin system RelE/ParE family toxin n=1 Tax=Campylobacter iguaniorum TaxID=1244531 RepID=UPI00119DCBB0